MTSVPHATKHVAAALSRVRAGGLALAVAVLAACTQTPSDGGPPGISFAEMRFALDSQLAECTEPYGFDPREPSETGENELAVGEREWLECAYEGIEKVMVPNTKFPKMYHQLISDGRSMTDLVEQGEITRTQRRNAIQAAIIEIENAEIVSLIRSSEAATEEADRARTAELRRTFASIRTMAFPQASGRR